MKSKMKKRIFLTVMLLPILCFIVVWGISLAKCEILTLRHGSEFTSEDLLTIYDEHTMVGDFGFIKVLEYSENTSLIYYVNKEKAVGSTLRFTRNNGEWSMKSWNTVWSKYGTADERVWPYFWQGIVFLWQIE